MPATSWQRGYRVLGGHGMIDLKQRAGQDYEVMTRLSAGRRFRDLVTAGLNIGVHYVSARTQSVYAGQLQTSSLRHLNFADANFNS
jgi:hypothetical protein